MRVYRSTLRKAMSALYRQAVEPSARLIEERQLEDEWMLQTGLRRSDFHDAMNDMRLEHWVVNVQHGALKCIKFTPEGLVQLQSPESSGMIRDLLDWITLKRAHLRVLKRGPRALPPARIADVSRSPAGIPQGS